MGWDQSILVTDPTTGRKKWQRRKRPAKGLRKYIRCKKRFERQQAFEALVAEQRRKNWQIEQPLPGKIPTKQRQPTPEPLIPNDAIGRIILMAMEWCPIKEGEILLIHQLSRVKTFSYMAHIKIPEGQSFTTFGALYKWMVEENKQNQDPLWQNLSHYLMMSHGITISRHEQLSWSIWRQFLCAWAEQEYEVILWSQNGSSIHTLGDFFELAKEAIGRKRADDAWAKLR